MKHKSVDYKLSAVNYYLNHEDGYDNIDLYFETDIDSYNISFQISKIYKFEIKLMLLFNEKNFNLYIDDEFIK